ncbi:hypothetical protein BGZ47_004161 [Haplosporangium gracile]|nr:hypothetical protein BGZ47_004161 [Haplosporangium gracile]
MKRISTILSVFATTSLAASASIHSNNGLTGALLIGNTLTGGSINELTARSIAQDNEVSMTSMFSKRNFHMDALLDVIIEANTKMSVKALAKLNLDLCSDIHARVKVVASGQLTTNLDLVIPKISAKINA